MRSFICTAMLLFGAMVFSGTALAQGAKALVGIWSVRVSVKDAGPASGDSDKLIIFSADGTTTESNGEPGFGAAVGQWSYGGNHKFHVIWYKQIRNAVTGELSAVVKVRNTYTMSSDGQSFSGDSTADGYSPDLKHVLFSFPATVSGQRLDTDPAK